jgi:hypothetical protein
VAHPFYKLVEQGNLQCYLSLERYWNDGSPSGFNTTVSSRYAPFSPEQSFPLPVHAFERTQCIQIGRLPFTWARSILAEGKTPMPLHPDVASELTRQMQLSDTARQYPEVVPTASGRTVFCYSSEAEPHFIKLHYPRRLGRFKRDLSLGKWLSSLEISRELFLLQNQFPSCLAFLYESAGTFFEGPSGTPGFGVLYREFKPRPLKDSLLLVPGFSLFSKNGLPDDTRPLLIEWLCNSSSPFESFIKHFIRPALRSYIFLACENGLLPECNAQNILYELNLSTGETRFVIRDMASFSRDFTLRRRLGLHDSFCSYKSIDEKYDLDFYQRRSLSYDFKFGEYLLRPLVETFARWMKVPLSTVIGAVREEARLAWSKFDDYFNPPERWYAYPAQEEVKRGNYIELKNPSFR